MKHYTFFKYKTTIAILVSNDFSKENIRSMTRYRKLSSQVLFIFVRYRCHDPKIKLFDPNSSISAAVIRTHNL